MPDFQRSQTLFERQKYLIEQSYKFGSIPAYQSVEDAAVWDERLEQVFENIDARRILLVWVSFGLNIQKQYRIHVLYGRKDIK